MRQSLQGAWDVYTEGWCSAAIYTAVYTEVVDHAASSRHVQTKIVS